MRCPVIADHGSFIFVLFSSQSLSRVCRRDRTPPVFVFCVCVCVFHPRPIKNNVLAIRLHGSKIGRSDRRDLAELMLRVEAPLNGESPRRFGGARSTLAPSSLCNLCIVYRGSPAILILYNFVTDAVDFMAFIVFLAGAAAAAIFPAAFIAFIASMPFGMVKKGRT